MQTFTLRNKKGMIIEVIDFGGIVTKIIVPDKSGKLGDVVLGFDDVETYLRSNPAYFGALIGRFANRIAQARFTLDGRTYELPKNDGRHTLHGGLKGFDKVFWKVEEIEKGRVLRLSYTSADQEEGYPGRLVVTVDYSLNDDCEFTLQYTATTDQPTIVNLTHHSYFNLSGVPGSDILDHEIRIDADHYTSFDSECISTGKLREVHGPFDLRSPKRVGERIGEVVNGYDQNFVLNHPGARNVVARLRHPASGRTLEVMTTEPGLQFYAGHFVDVPGKERKHYGRYAGLCLEAQHFPDSPNQPHFPSTVLRPGETYQQVTTYRFGVSP